MDELRNKVHLLRCDIREGVNMTYAFGVDISKYQSSQNGKILQDFDALANHSEKVSFIFEIGRASCRERVFSSV